MAELTQEQKDQFWRDGVLVVEDAVTAEQLEGLRAVFSGWVEKVASMMTTTVILWTGGHGLTLNQGIQLNNLLCAVCNPLKRCRRSMPISCTMLEQ